MEFRSRRRKTSGPEKDLRKRKMRIRRQRKKIFPDFLRCLGRCCRSTQRSVLMFLFPAPPNTPPSELAELLKQEDRPIYVAVNEDDVCWRYAFCQMQEQPFSTNMVPFKSLFIDDLCVDQQGKGTAHRRKACLNM